MTKLDPIIAVKDVEASVQWYQQVFGFDRAHGGEGNFAVLLVETNEIILCLHKWEEHGHPTMMNSAIKPGNGLILYFKTDRLNTIRDNLVKARGTVEEEIHQNPNSLKKEFSFRDPDGYYLTVTEYHEY